MKFRRKKDTEEEETAVDATVPVAEASPEDSSWALPADAAVASGGDVASAQAPEPAAVADPSQSGKPASEAAAPAAPDQPISAARMSAPGIGTEDGPRAAAAAAAGSFAQPPKPDPEPAGASPAPGNATDKPELLVAGAFVGAFLFAKIIKRIGD